MHKSYTITLTATHEDNDLAYTTTLFVTDEEDCEEEVKEFIEEVEKDEDLLRWGYKVGTRITRVGDHVPEQAGQFIAHFIDREGNLNPKFWEWQDLMERSHLDEEVWEAAYEIGVPPDKVEGAYAGEYSSDSDYAFQYAEDMGLLEKEVRWPYTEIDWEQAAKELDFTEENGHYFYNNW